MKTMKNTNFTIGGRIVITAHPKADEILNVRTVSEKASASDLIHIYAELSRTWLRSGYQQSRSYKKNIPSLIRIMTRQKRTAGR